MTIDFLYAKQYVFCPLEVRREVVRVDQKTEFSLCLGTNILGAPVSHLKALCVLKNPAVLGKLG